MEINRIDLFSTPVWSTTLKDINLLDIKKYVLQLQKNDKNGVQITNQGGWQSPASNIFPPYKSFSQLKNSISIVINTCTSYMELGFSLKLQNYWFNINEYGDYNDLHNHRGAILSGVFYIDIPQKNSGNIRFQRDDDIDYYIPHNLIKKYNLNNGSSVSYAPMNGKLYIFPSWLKHAVESNRSQETRISMSFNYGL